MPVFIQPSSYFSRDTSSKPGSASTITTTTIDNSNVTPLSSETESTTSRLPFLGDHVSSHIYAVVLIALTVVVLVRVATARAGVGAATRARGWNQPFSLLLVLLWTRIAHKINGNTNSRPNTDRRQFLKDHKRAVIARSGGEFGFRAASEKDAPPSQEHQGRVGKDARHYRTLVWASDSPVAAAPTGAASIGAGVAPSAPASAPAATGAAGSAGMDSQNNEPGSRGVSANYGADLPAQRQSPAAEKGPGQPFSRPSPPPSHSPAVGRTDGALQDRTIMDSDRWSGALARGLAGDATAAAASASEAGATASAVDDSASDDSSASASKMILGASAFGSAPLAGAGTLEAGGSRGRIGIGSSGPARGREPGSGCEQGTEQGISPSLGSGLGFATPRQFQFVTRTPLQPTLRFPPSSLSSTVSAVYPSFENRRTGYAASIPPALDVARDISFIHQPNPDYLLASGSGDGSASGSGSSGLDSAMSPESASTSELVCAGPSSSPSTPRESGYIKALSIGGDDIASSLPIPISHASTGSGSEGTGPHPHRREGTSSMPSSFPSAAPMLPPPPPGSGDYGHDATFFSAPPHHSALATHHGSFEEQEGGEPRGIDVHGEIISMLDDAGASWTRHTRVYGGGPCLACLASGGGFYGDTVPLEERRPR